MSINKTPEKNSILFVWLNNYAGILLKTPSKTLVIDPVDVKAKNLQSIDAILITHEHDHLDPLLITDVQATGCTVIADSSARKLQLAIPKNCEPSMGMETKIGEVTVKARQPPGQTY
jgi:L-ascorbate metabolism protein UlaG (beta-lactamase superfamily)